MLRDQTAGVDHRGCGRPSPGRSDGIEPRVERNPAAMTRNPWLRSSAPLPGAGSRESASAARECPVARRVSFLRTRLCQRDTDESQRGARECQLLAYESQRGAYECCWERREWRWETRQWCWERRVAIRETRGRTADTRAIGLPSRRANRVRAFGAPFRHDPGAFRGSVRVVSARPLERGAADRDARNPAAMSARGGVTGNMWIA